jgi:hypothetical protein
MPTFQKKEAAPIEPLFPEYKKGSSQVGDPFYTVNKLLFIIKFYLI